MTSYRFRFGSFWRSTQIPSVSDRQICIFVCGRSWQKKRYPFKEDTPLLSVAPNCVKFFSVIERFLFFFTVIEKDTQTVGIDGYRKPEVFGHIYKCLIIPEQTFVFCHIHTDGDTGRIVEKRLNAIFVSVTEPVIRCAVSLNKFTGIPFPFSIQMFGYFCRFAEFWSGITDGT